MVTAAEDLVFIYIILNFLLSPIILIFHSATGFKYFNINHYDKYRIKLIVLSVILFLINIISVVAWSDTGIMFSVIAVFHLLNIAITYKQFNEEFRESIVKRKKQRIEDAFENLSNNNI